MNSKLSPEQTRLHQKACELSTSHRKIEWLLIETIQKIDNQKIYKLLGHRSLFEYAVKSLGLSESVAYGFISVARKAQMVEALKEDLKDQKLSVSKASRIVSVLTAENANALLEFAHNQTSREIDLKVAELRPQAARRERTKPLSAAIMELKLSVPQEVFNNFRRAQDVAAQKENKNMDLTDTLAIVLKDYLQRHDPVVKAERALAKRKRHQDKRHQDQSNQVRRDQDPQDQDLRHQYPPDIFQSTHDSKNSELCLVKNEREEKPRIARVRFTALEKHQIFARDGGRCTFVDSSGERCHERRWLHLHHLRPVSLGGGNEPENITTLCSFHHDLSHQLSLGIEGQVTWLQ